MPNVRNIATPHQQQNLIQNPSHERDHVNDAFEGNENESPAKERAVSRRHKTRNRKTKHSAEKEEIH